MPNLLKISTWADEHFIHAVIEPPRGSSCKLDFDPKLRVFTLAKPLMAGLTYPYDWGFIPSTQAEDGDPLDVLVIHDAQTYPGVVELAFVALHRRRRQHFGQEQRAQPAAALFHHLPKADFHVRLVDGRHAAELLHVLGGFLHDGVDDVVDRDDSNDATMVDDRHREEVVLRDQARDIFPIHQGSGGDQTAWTGYRQHRCFQISRDQPAQGDRFDQLLAQRIQHVDRVDGFRWVI
jgi:hypothetical protein